jgi:ABC-type branched-subunit amino acid transport system substrate-binding protein
MFAFIPEFADGITDFSNDAPTNVKIGVMTSMFTLDWYSDTGTQYLGAILLAIDEINQNASILPRTTIQVAYQDSHLDAGSAFFDSLALSTQQFNDSIGVDVLLGPVTSAEAEASAVVLKEFEIPQISMSATSPDLSYKKNYPYFLRTCPSDAFQGRAMADLVAQQYKWSVIEYFTCFFHALHVTVTIVL